jgi:hypothetical protein
MQKIIVIILVFMSFSCKSEREINTVETKITQLMQELYNEGQKSWRLLELLNGGDVSLADGYAFLAVVEILEINNFIQRTRINLKLYLTMLKNILKHSF